MKLQVYSWLNVRRVLQREYAMVGAYKIASVEKDNRVLLVREVRYVM